MLPTTGALTQAQRDDVRTAVTEYIQNHGITLKDIAKQMGGGSHTVISQVINNTYRAGVDDHLRSLNDWMEIDARRRRTRPDDKFVEIRVAKLIIGCASKASQMRTMVVAHGPTGIGKTTVGHIIAEKFTGSIFLTMAEGSNSATAVRRMIAAALRLDRRPHVASAVGMPLNERIFDRLHDSHRMIIIDEAHSISDGALRFLRSVFDRCGVPILFLCTKDLVDRIRCDADEDHGQLYSRFGYICDLTRGCDKTPGGKNPRFSVSEIRAILETDKVRLHTGAQSYLQDVANMMGQGSLRRCKRIMRWAVAIERRKANLGPNDRVVITEAAVKKADMESMPDRAMQDDIAALRTPMANMA